MINFDSVTLKRFISENSEFLCGARIQKIQQPTRRELVITLRNKGMARKLYINIEPQHYHICFMSEENELKRAMEIPKQPPMFCMLLRKYLENAKISKINQPEFERIIEFYFETYNEISEKIYLCLAIELMGKHSNVVLYNCDTNIIIGCAHNVGAEKSREREMVGGVPYVYPPGGNKYWYRTEKSLADAEGDINSAIDNYYSDVTSKDKLIKLKSKYSTVVSDKIKKTKNSLEKMKKQTISEQKAEKYRLYGDLIMANMYNNQDYSCAITVFNYENNKNISIDLDETKTLKDNANRYYKLYNKAKKSNRKSGEITEELNQKLEYLEQLLYSVEIAENITDLDEISSEIYPDKTQKSGGKSAVMPQVITEKDYTIYIGKNNRQNDYIVSKLARDNDLWFHAHNCAGSHVLLRAENITDKLVYMCAKIAKEDSKGANSSKVGVIYTYAKYLKKPPKANLGYVTYSHEKEIIID